MRYRREVFALTVAGLLLPLVCSAAGPIDIGSRRELFVDRYLIDTFQDGARLMLHRPIPREVVLTHDEPWEGNICGYATILRDDDTYRMVCRGAKTHPKTGIYSIRFTTRE